MNKVYSSRVTFDKEEITKIICTLLFLSPTKATWLCAKIWDNSHIKKKGMNPTTNNSMKSINRDSRHEVSREKKWNTKWSNKVKAIFYNNHWMIHFVLEIVLFLSKDILCIRVYCLSTLWVFESLCSIKQYVCESQELLSNKIILVCS